jgi:uncharacterized repeat protein (TIGR03803 family)
MMTKLRSELIRQRRGGDAASFRSWETACAAFLIFAATVLAAPAQTFNSLVDFDGANGGNPAFVSFVQGTDGNLYGTTSLGGNLKICNGIGCGTVFKMTPDGKLTTLHNFDDHDGFFPDPGLVQATDGNFYGTTTQGGGSSCSGNGCGTLFRITAGGALSTLYRFCAKTNCPDGQLPIGALVQASDGNFYGTTYFGGANNKGTVFKITATGKLTTLHSFCAQTNCPDGYGPTGALIQATDGNFYGTTLVGGGSYKSGTVFKITPAGKLTTLYSFCSQNQNCPDGASVFAGLVQASNGDFYGTNTSAGALSGGTLFRITSAGKLTTLYTFCGQVGCPQIEQPYGTLIQATDGNLYGTTYYGGDGMNNFGALFKITLAGKLTTLHKFETVTGGEYPEGGLVQDTDGNFYGTTNAGGTSYNCYEGTCGTIFSLAVGLRPFVETRPTFGKVATAVVILGTNLTGATSVTFNGTAAKFTVVSSSEITTTVPSGATSGKVKVVTPHGTLVSNTVFRVR